MHVPKGVELEKPLYVQVTSNGGSLFWRMVVIAEEGARFSLIEDISSVAEDTVAYTNAVVELFVEQAAKIEYVSLQNLSRETWHFGRYKAWLERDTELDWVIGGFGSKRGKVWIENDLAGPGATSRVTGAYFADGDQHLDYDTFQGDPPGRVLGPARRSSGLVKVKPPCFSSSSWERFGRSSSRPRPACATFRPFIAAPRSPWDRSDCTSGSK